MKRRLSIRSKIVLILVVTLLISAHLQGQNWKRGLAVVGYHTATIALGAIGDAQYDMGNKNTAHILKAGEVATLIGGPFIFRVDKRDAASYLLSYCFLRFSLFDSFYNLTRDLPLLYNGTTSKYDQFMTQIPPHGRAWRKSCSLVVGFSIPIRNL